MSTLETQPTLGFVQCPDGAAGHRMAYWQWGEHSAGHVVICVHGLTRQGRDFDVLAAALCREAAARGTPLRVVCPDVAGRGRSDWLADPMAYAVPTYAADMLALALELHRQAPIATLDWVGTSMGGLIGMAVCGQQNLPLPVPVRRLILNDVGPSIQWAAVERIAAYVGNTGRFANAQAAADAMWGVSSSFGPHTREEWLALSRPMVRPLDPAQPQGDVTLHYDPKLALPIKALTPELAEQGEALIWSLYDQIRAQVLLLRGAQSDLLSVATAQAMSQRGPKATLLEFLGVGHAPTLVHADQVRPVVEWLLA